MKSSPKHFSLFLFIYFFFLFNSYADPVNLTLDIGKSCISQKNCDQACIDACEESTGKSCGYYYSLCQDCIKKFPETLDQSESSGMIDTCPVCFKNNPEYTKSKECILTTTLNQQALGKPSYKTVECFVSCKSE